MAAFNSPWVKVGTHNQPMTKHNNHSQTVPTACPSDGLFVPSLRETKESTSVKRYAITTHATDEAVATDQAFLRCRRSLTSWNQ